MMLVPISFDPKTVTPPPNGNWPIIQMLSPVVALTYRVTVDVPARIADIGEGLKSADCVKFV